MAGSWVSSRYEMNRRQGARRPPASSPRGRDREGPYCPPGSVRGRRPPPLRPLQSSQPRRHRRVGQPRSTGAVWLSALRPAVLEPARAPGHRTMSAGRDLIHPSAKRIPRGGIDGGVVRQRSIVPATRKTSTLQRRDPRLVSPGAAPGHLRIDTWLVPTRSDCVSGSSRPVITQLASCPASLSSPLASPSASCRTSSIGVGVAICRPSRPLAQWIVWDDAHGAVRVEAVSARAAHADERERREHAHCTTSS